MCAYWCPATLVITFGALLEKQRTFFNSRYFPFLIYRCNDFVYVHAAVHYRKGNDLVKDSINNVRCVNNGITSLYVVLSRGCYKYHTRKGTIIKCVPYGIPIPGGRHIRVHFYQVGLFLRKSPL